MLKYLKSLQVLFTCSLFRLFPLTISRMINWGWSKIELVMLPERYLKDGLFTKMLSICVADFPITLVGSVIYGIKLWLKSNLRKLYMCLFFIIIDKIYFKTTCEQVPFIFIIDCINRLSTENIEKFMGNMGFSKQNI